MATFSSCCFFSRRGFHSLSICSVAQRQKKKQLFFTQIQKGIRRGDGGGFVVWEWNVFFHLIANKFFKRAKKDAKRNAVKQEEIYAKLNWNLLRESWKQKSTLFSLFACSFECQKIIHRFSWNACILIVDILAYVECYSPTRPSL